MPLVYTEMSDACVVVVFLADEAECLGMSRSTAGQSGQDDHLG